MATAANIITAAFLKVQVESPTTAQNASALTSLNNMISLWGGDELIYSVTSEGFTVDSGDKEYTIGSGGQWDTVRPIRVVSAFLRDSDSHDYPLSVFPSRNYNALSEKTYSGRPAGLYFLPEYPLAKIIFSCSPDASYSAYFEFLKTFSEFAASSDSVVLPPEYKQALVYNLAIAMGEDWDRVVPQTVIAEATRSRAILERVIASTKPPAKAKFDFAGLEGQDGYDYAIVSDETIDGGVF